MAGCVGPSRGGRQRARKDRVDALRQAARVWIVVLASPSVAGAADWPPADPADEQAPIALTTAWAAAQRDVHRLADLQQAAGARGRIASVEIDGETPRVVYAWTGLGHRGEMRAFLYADGGFAAIIVPADAGGEIVLNSFGAFVCPGCTPSVNACGHRPSWVPHDVHWDTFDCAHTLTGPQSLYARDRR